MLLKEYYKQLISDKTAVIATNVYNYETLRGIISAAQQTQSKVILQLSKSSLEYLGIKTAVGMCSAALKESGVDGWIHLDHGDSIELVETCLDAGFDSIMIDGSELEFEENVRLTKKAKEIASKYKVPVEAELGFVAKLGQSISRNQLGFTKPEEAKLFVELTNVDSLAVSIGSAHGFYKEKPNLDFIRLAEIRAILPKTPLVLHGSSGIKHSDLKKVISHGINKINVATEFKNIFMNSIRIEVSKNDEIDLRKIFPPAIKAVKELAITKFELT